ncbi:MAG: ATP/GTP-binding protein [Solirubrobacteraceae bacterium]
MIRLRPPTRTRNGSDFALEASNRGWKRPAGGYSSWVQAPLGWRATSVQACGMWPFSVGAGAPLIGAPLGKHIVTHAAVCADPISWFQRAKLITAPTGFLLALNGYGKSSVIRRMVIALSAFGCLPMVLGDLKPDYVDLIEALDGQIIRLGRGRGYLNPLDITLARSAARQLGAAHGKLRDEVLADATGRRHQMVLALVEIQRGAMIDEHEDPMLTEALRCLDDRHPGVPVLSDLLEVLADAPDNVRAAAVDHGDIARYHAKVERLQVTLQALLGAGRVGEMFSRHSSVDLRLDRPVVYDVSSIPIDDTALVSAALTACWGTGFGAVNVSNMLAEAGLGPQRHYFLVLDELWRALQAGHGMVHRIDALTRLNRQWGVGTMMCSHTIKDLLSLPTEHERMRALGLIERSRMHILGALTPEEMPRLAAVTDLSLAEQQELISWQDPPAWAAAAQNDAPPGRGKFMLKLSGRPGIPFEVKLTEAELRLGDTNKLWHTASRINRPQTEVA